MHVSKMREKDKELLRKFCHYYKKEFNCECYSCALYGLLWCNNKIYDKGWDMPQAIRHLARTSIPNQTEEAKKILSEKIGAPLHIVQMLLREIEDYEKNEKSSL